MEPRSGAKSKVLLPMDTESGCVPSLPWNQWHPKSSDNSERCRIFGNICLQNGDLKLGLEYYNASLCYAPPGSKDTPLIYANRSTAFSLLGKHSFALENIKLARENGYPAEKLAQLDVREEKCRKAIETSGPDKNAVADSFFKLSYPPNEKIPFIAGCLELRKNEKYGRHIITTKDLKAGDIIAIESSAISFTDEKITSPACMLCTKTNHGSLLPCNHCTKVMFCSRECREKAALLHFTDGFAENCSSKFKNLMKMLLEAYRVAGGADKMLESIKEAKTVFDFDFSNPDDPSYEINLLTALNGLWRDESQEMNENDLKELLNVAIVNAEPKTVEERKKLKNFIIHQYQIYAANYEVFAGSHAGIFLLKPLLSHSCIPNVDRVKFGNKLVLYVSRPIKAGSQILNCYAAGFHAALNSKTERMKVLQKVYKFQCDCEACSNDWPQEFPRKDRRYVEPKFVKVAPAEAIEQFKKNCRIMEKLSGKVPSIELSISTLYNHFMAQCIAGNEVVIGQFIKQLSSE